MRPRDIAEIERIEAGLAAFGNADHALPGVAAPAAARTLARQMVESQRRVQFPSRVADRPISPRRLDPDDEMFDPIRAARLCVAAGDLEEAAWLTFLFVHFGSNPRTRWLLLRRVYSRLGDGRWSWPAVAGGPAEFAEWLSENASEVRGDERAGFGNHRKYESLADTPGAVQSYVDWVGESHSTRIAAAMAAANDDSATAFDHLYASLDAVARFGRTARFDYLTMLGKLEIAEIGPGRPYLAGATGPLRGSQLLLGRFESPSTIEPIIVRLGSALQLGMQVMEDSLCNWQKSPEAFVAFRG